jgi:hypothetical protein
MKQLSKKKKEPRRTRGAFVYNIEYLEEVEAFCKIQEM